MCLNSEVHPIDRLNFLAKVTFEDFHRYESSNVTYISDSSGLYVGSKGEVIIQPFVVIDGPIFLEDGVFIGPYSFLRGPLYLGKNVRIGPYCEVTRSVIMDNSIIAHKNIIPDSIIENDVWISGGVIFCNTRLDQKPIKLKWKEDIKMTDKFGAFVESNSRLGVNVTAMPATYISKSSIIVGPSTIGGFIEG